MKLRQTPKTELIRYKQKILLRVVVKTADEGSTMKITGPSDFLAGLLSRKDTDEQSFNRGRRGGRHVCRRSGEPETDATFLFLKKNEKLGKKTVYYRKRKMQRNK